MATDTGFELSTFERFVLSRLTSAKTLAGLRTVAPDRFSETVRALAVLVATGLVTPQRKSSSVVEAIGQGEEGAVALPSLARQCPLPPASSRVKELLARLEEIELQATARYSLDSLHGQETPTRRKGEAFRRTALCMLADGDNEKAAYRLLTRAANLAPSAAVLVDLARFEIQHQRWHSRVVEHLKRALQMDPTCEDAWSLLVEYWELRHREDKLRRTVERWLAANPNSTAAHERLETLAGARSRG